MKVMVEEVGMCNPYLCWKEYKSVTEYRWKGARTILVNCRVEVMKYVFLSVYVSEDKKRN